MDKQKTRLALRQVLFFQFTWRQIQVRLQFTPSPYKLLLRFNFIERKQLN